MDIVKTSMVFTRTIKNVSRLREIVTVFARNGFDEFISGGITSHIPNFVLPRSKTKIKEELSTRSEKDWPHIIGFRLRKCFEELGPSFVKFGQLMSSREDVFDQSFIDQMRLLRDQAKGIPFESAKEIIEKSLECKIGEVFKEINEEPIGTASIGVVYEGTLKDGSEIVIKVRRPHINKIIETDFNILAFLISQIEKVSDEMKSLGISRIIDDFGTSLQNELNFNYEAINCVRFTKNLKKYDKDNILYLPNVYKEYVHEDMLVLEKLKGISFSEQKEILKNREVVDNNLKKVIEIFSKTYLNDGFFHADLHSGNMFLLPNGKIGIIDFGLMGNLSKKGRRSFIAILYSLLSHNYENLVYEFLDVADYDNIPDVNSLVYDVRQALIPFIGLTISEINSSLLFNEVVKTLSKHRLFLPREWLLIFRSLMTLDGVGKSLNVGCDLFEVMEGNIKEIIATSITKDELLEEGVWATRDLLSSFRMFPRHFKWFLREFAKNNFALEVKSVGYQDELKSLVGAISFLSYAIVSSVLVFAGVNLISSESLGKLWNVSLMSLIFWAGACFIFMFGFLVTRKR